MHDRDKGYRFRRQDARDMPSIMTDGLTRALPWFAGALAVAMVLAMVVIVLLGRG